MIYVSFSGGCDSTAVALILKDQGIEFELVFADTGAELPETYFFIPRFARQIGKKLLVLSNGTFFQYMTNFGFLLPSVQTRWCTRLLKQVPQDKYYGDDNSIVHIGIRADEQHRANLKPRGKHTFAYPLIDAGLDKKGVLDMCRKNDALNPIYSWRSNCSCFCCPFQRIADWKGLLKHHPDLFMLAEAWEEESVMIAKEKELTEWRWMKNKKLGALRLADERQLKLFPEPEGEPCIICAI
jgi:hypothetical protein